METLNDIYTGEIMSVVKKPFLIILFIKENKMLMKTLYLFIYLSGNTIDIVIKLFLFYKTCLF